MLRIITLLLFAYLNFGRAITKRRRRVDFWRERKNRVQIVCSGRQIDNKTGERVWTKRTNSYETMRDRIENLVFLQRNRTPDFRRRRKNVRSGGRNAYETRTNYYVGLLRKIFFFSYSFGTGFASFRRFFRQIEKTETVKNTRCLSMRFIFVFRKFQNASGRYLPGNTVCESIRLLFRIQRKHIRLNLVGGDKRRTAAV